MKTFGLALIVLCVVLSCALCIAANDNPPPPQPAGQAPPLDWQPGPPPNPQFGPPQVNDRPRPQNRPGQGQGYSLSQAISDQAQLHTIAFNGLAFITGDFGAATFIPPGKVCDFFGFQYMRDIDAAHIGHNPMFLDRVAANVLYDLTPDQRAQFAALAREQAPQFRDIAIKRFPLIKAFYRQLNGELPKGSSGLNKESVKKYLGGLFAQDAELSYRRAEVYGKIVASLTPQQRAYLANMKFGDFSTWPAVDMESYKLQRGSDKLANIAYMTYASEFFSWYAGSIDADTYFCPERHGTYFGGFYMKDMPAMGKHDYNISTSLTGDSGAAFVAALTDDQRKNVTEIPALQRKDLQEVVDVRRSISTELRKFLRAGQADKKKVVALGLRYGELDGEMSWMYATAFAKVNRTLTADQRSALVKLRNLTGYTSPSAFIYSDPLSGTLTLPNTDHFFFAPK
jgi:Spy/CpxP family protein refolding chaperone